MHVRAASLHRFYRCDRFVTDAQTDKQTERQTDELLYKQQGEVIKFGYNYGYLIEQTGETKAGIICLISYCNSLNIASQWGLRFLGLLAELSTYLIKISQLNCDLQLLQQIRYFVGREGERQTLVQRGDARHAAATPCVAALEDQCPHRICSNFSIFLQRISFRTPCGREYLLRG